MPQVRATQARVIQICALQIGVAQIGLPKIGAPQREALQLGIRKVGFCAALPSGTQPGTVLSKDPRQLVQRHLPEHRICLRAIS